MNLRSGNYLSTEGVGRLLRHGIQQGGTYPQLVELVKTTFPTVPEDLAAAIDPFIDVDDSRADQRDADGKRGCPIRRTGPTQVSGTGEFRAPILNVYPDLLLLDPIHDFDEVGWPTSKSADR